MFGSLLPRTPGRVGDTICTLCGYLNTYITIITLVHVYVLSEMPHVIVNNNNIIYYIQTHHLNTAQHVSRDALYRCHGVYELCSVLHGRRRSRRSRPLVGCCVVPAQRRRDVHSSPCCDLSTIVDYPYFHIILL